ncbi:MAG: Rieske 2Fe-2S domain-containing protein [Actinomycetota bacterium]|nr:Rieske 2Fe-2S domain-containing protein [Actinomycetota bacterium]
MSESHVPPRGTGSSIGVAFGLSAIASLGLAVVYALGGQPQIEGALIGVSLGGLAYGFVMWAKLFLPGGDYVQERETLASAAEQREMFVEEASAGGRLIGRRKFLSKMLWTALGALGVALFFPVRSLGPSPGRALFNTPWAVGTRVVGENGLPVRVGDVLPGGVITVFPEGRTDAADAQAVLIRVNQADFVPVPGREGWSPDGNVAYSKICTHAGCPVGLYEPTSGDLFCPCHQSIFDARRGAVPTAGPATRPLPQLPLAVDREGFLIAAGEFSEPVGPSFWDLPE